MTAFNFGKAAHYVWPMSSVSALTWSNSDEMVIANMPSGEWLRRGATAPHG
jgi:hypothetical protein